MVGAGELADGVGEVSGGGGEGAASLVHTGGVCADAFGDDAAIPVGGAEDFEGLVAASGEAHVVGDAPGGGEGEAVGAGEAVGFVGVGPRVGGGVEPGVCGVEDGVGLGEEAEGGKAEEGAGGNLSEGVVGAVRGGGEDRGGCAGRGGDGVGEDGGVEGGGALGHLLGGFGVLEGGVDIGEAEEGAPDEDVVAGEEGEDLELVLGVLEGGVEAGGFVEAAEEAVAEEIDGGLMGCQEGGVVGGRVVGGEGDDGGGSFIELEAVFEDSAAEEAGVGAGVAELGGEGVVEGLAGEGFIDIEECGEAPEHGVAVPVGCGDVVAGGAGGDADELFGVEGAAPGVELGEEKVAVHEEVEFGLAGGACSGTAPGGGFQDGGVGAVAVEEFAEGAGSVGSGEFFDTDTEDEECLGGFAGGEGGGVANVGGGGGGEWGHGGIGGGAGVDDGEGEVSVGGEEAEGFPGGDPGGLADGAVAAEGNWDVGDTAEGAEAGAEAEGDGDGAGGVVVEGEAEEGTAGTGGGAPGEGGVEVGEGEDCGGDPVGVEGPGGVVEGEWLVVGLEIGLEGGGTLVAGDLEEAAVVHGEDVEGGEGTVRGADVGEGEPLVTCWDDIVGGEVECLGVGDGKGDGKEEEKGGEAEGMEELHDITSRRPGV